MTKFYNNMTLLQKHVFGFLVFIFGLLIGGIVSFCSADNLPFNLDYISNTSIYSGKISDLNFSSDNRYFYFPVSTGDYCFLFYDTRGTNPSPSQGFYFSPYNPNGNVSRLYQFIYGYSFISSYIPYHLLCYQASSISNSLTGVMYFSSVSSKTQYSGLYYYIFPFNSLLGGASSCSPSSIGVLYNNSQSVEDIVCNGDNIISIEGLSTITNTNTFTPYFNINYRDEDNQLLVESYSKDILYLSGGTFKKTYTGDNFWVLNNLGLPKEEYFTGYLPTFDFTGAGIQDVSDSGNIFNNFAENGLKVLLSNIPNYIQYIIMIILLFFIMGIIKKIRRR